MMGTGGKLAEERERKKQGGGVKKKGWGEGLREKRKMKRRKEKE